MKDWLKKNSTLYRRFNPLPFYHCEFCGNPVPQPSKVHRTGTVTYSKRKVAALYCDASERIIRE